MKRYNTIYYFLFMAVIMGAFASMAQNSYGMKLMGCACLGFSITFLHELIFSVPSYPDMTRQRKRWLALELAALSLMALLFFFRSFLIEIMFGKEAVLLSLFALGVVSIFNSFVYINRTWRANKLLSFGIVSYYGALIFFIITFVAGVVRPAAAKMLGPVGFIFLLGFVLTGLVFRSKVFEGEKISLLHFVRTMKNKSGITMIGFILIFLYFGLSQAAIFPPLYSGKMPSGYLELIRRAESGEEKTNGKKRYEQFEEQYSKLVRRHRK